MLSEVGDKYELRRSFLSFLLILVVLSSVAFCLFVCFLGGGILVFFRLLQSEECRNPLCYIRLEPQIYHSNLDSRDCRVLEL